VKSLLNRVWREDEGVLTFEWILLITVLVIGIVGGLSAVRDATITELGDVVEAMVSLDQSFSILAPWDIQVPDGGTDGASNSSYQDNAGVCQGRLATGEYPTQNAIGDCTGLGAEAPIYP
jgi:Flp pilus assembly pilin Flp